MTDITQALDHLTEDQRDRLAAAVSMIGRTGADSTELRIVAAEHTDNADHLCPVVFVAIALYGRRLDRAGKRRASRAGTPLCQTGSGVEPLEALEALLDKLLDGGACQHCRRVTSVAHAGENDLGPMVCTWTYDAEAKKYRRGCEPQ